MSEGLARSNDLISLVDASLPSPATVLSSHALEAGPAASDAAVGSGSGAGHDVVMDDQSFDSSKGGKMELDEAATSNAERIDEPSAADQIAYTLAVEARQSQYRPRSSPSAPKSYSIESIYTIPHSTSINALSLPPCSSHIYSGGSDGIIRRYNLHATLNGNGGSENPDLYNLTAKPGGASTDRAIPVLVGYWENEEEGEWCNALTTDVKWGRKNDMINKVSPVHSLAIQSQELWGLSGTAVSYFKIAHYSRGVFGRTYAEAARESTERIDQSFYRSTRPRADPSRLPLIDNSFSRSSVEISCIRPDALRRRINDAQRRMGQFDYRTHSQHSLLSLSTLAVISS